MTTNIQIGTGTPNLPDDNIPRRRSSTPGPAVGRAAPRGG